MILNLILIDESVPFSSHLLTILCWWSISTECRKKKNRTNSFHFWPHVLPTSNSIASCLLARPSLLSLFLYIFNPTSISMEESPSFLATRRYVPFTLYFLSFLRVCSSRSSFRLWQDWHGLVPMSNMICRGYSWYEYRSRFVVVASLHWR